VICWEVLKNSHPHNEVEAHTLQYVVKVPKEGKVTVNYRVRMRWQVIARLSRPARPSAGPLCFDHGRKDRRLTSCKHNNMR